MNRRFLSHAAFTLFLLNTITIAAAQYAVTKTLPVGGDGGWDYATIDDKGALLYLPRTTHTQVVDTATGKLVADIPGLGLGHGVALVPDLNRGFITDGKNAVAMIFDLTTYAVLGTVPAADDADGIIRDPATNRICIACGDSASLVVIAADVDPKNGKPLASIDLGGKPEFLASDAAGRVFVNLTDKAQVAVVDIKSLKVTDKWSIAPGTRATGMSIDREKGRLYIGCRNKHMIVLSTKDGSVLADFPIGSGVDAAGFYNGVGFSSCGDGTLWAVSETSPGKFDLVEKITTPTGARTMAIDPQTGAIYLPCADMKAPAGGGRAQPVPGTFRVAVITKQ